MKNQITDLDQLINELLEPLAAYPKGKIFDGFRLADYLGTPRDVYKIPTPEVRKIARYFLRRHPNLSTEEVASLLTKLYRGETYTERQLASCLLGFLNSFRHSSAPALLESWLDHLVGWCEIDNLCQSNFSAVEVLANWPAWEKLFGRLVLSENISHRRASLVLLTRAVRESDDRRLAKIGFANIEQIEAERDILITKAVSWLLRELITHHRDRVTAYLKNHQGTLPKIALREVTRKLTTGKK